MSVEDPSTKLADRSSQLLTQLDIAASIADLNPPQAEVAQLLHNSLGRLALTTRCYFLSIA
ncbi:hypothetical protein N7468_010674 [Penicillium chermesinum]|uniref:Uncharacterized protein n=1 Tax=Penicillium chermesinum TaxID=63820 RepID=A0A9W9N840_9EURO|nr:uncharacterized protein N7468_010674 [Penicillium chermesinum]KAJ5214995.1 hypothetical protein N7468_010674 [Penicillium chermesinum]KAJ6141504.1 hypothetical protein N7470_009894 [Penicillium chermesinum]